MFKFSSKDGGHYKSWYHSFLPTTTTRSSNQQQRPQILHSYQNVVAGFAAKLTAEQGVTIVVVDSGISPEHPSFNDQGVPLPPSKWKGKCKFNSKLCNKKLIGARNLATKTEPPFDCNGHGSHTASTAAGNTAAGNFVKGANVFGNTYGTAVGVAPHAHLAIYKACSKKGCAESEILAAIGVAVGDGVDVLSISLGHVSPHLTPFYSDLTAIVGASTIDRTIEATARLGNEAKYDGGRIARTAKDEEVKRADGVAIILMNEKPDGYSTSADAHVLPTTHVDYASGLKIKDYINSTKDPKATILFKGTVIGNQKFAPAVASLSSRGPN
ncbi:hypothetical protein FNV43_RR16301 [Rhamnella rubrinervis]|uniref:Peptidase S8/S53 domain-containing protein n=1 Tax=Rhamnella rubrinervis TaxID=2594499 RepID=A0A8K0MCN6_9ROSA|nr:hypothetical protein FNV43_RR16301 [Rhamnella rubrinervis]